MPEYKLGIIESRFADIVWRNAPIGSGALAKLCEKELGWKRTTTYTVLKKFCNRGIFQNTKGTVTVCMTRDEFYAAQSAEFVDESFDGSLPAFFAAFTSHKALTEKEVAEIRAMIDAYGKEE